MDANMGWREAIAEVLKTSDTPLHYSDIAQAIIDRGYRQNVGATPAATVAANLSMSLKQDGDSSPFVRVKRAMYALRGASLSTAAGPETEDEPDEATEDAAQMGLINAFGMFWQRNDVYWLRGKPRLLGVQQSGSSPVNFSAQAGVYLLYDGSRVIYVGRVTEPRLGLRLWEHTRDRLSGRWDRFSWFGVRGVNGEGELRPMPVAGIAVPGLIATLEALLIEGLEPPQNRRQGDGFNAVEFIQVPDETVVTQREKQLLAKMSEQIGLR